jgi:hypothetical protein
MPNQIILTYCLASYNSIIRLPLIILQTKYRPVSKEIQELYLDSNTISTILSIFRTSIKYYKKTADFQDRDYLVTKVFKDMGIIIKPPADLIAHFDLTIYNRVKL